MGFWHNVGEFLFFGWLCNKFRHREHTHDEYGGRYIDDNDDIEDEEDDRHSAPTTLMTTITTTAFLTTSDRILLKMI